MPTSLPKTPVALLEVLYKQKMGEVLLFFLKVEE